MFELAEVTTHPKTTAIAWSDAAFKDRLVDDPHGALAEQGMHVPDGITVKVVENTEDNLHLVLPLSPMEEGELVLNDLEKCTGSAAYTIVFAMCWSVPPKSCPL